MWSKYWGCGMPVMSSDSLPDTTAENVRQNPSVIGQDL